MDLIRQVLIANFMTEKKTHALEAPRSSLDLVSILVEKL